MREELPESPECDVFLSILVCGGERLALTALTVVGMCVQLAPMHQCCGHFLVLFVLTSRPMA